MQAIVSAIRRELEKAVTSHPRVNDPIDLNAMHLGLKQVLIGVEIHLQDEMPTDAVEVVITEFEAAVRVIAAQADYLTIEAKLPA